MHVALLGPLVVDHDGQPVVIGGTRLRALFLRLALEPGRWLSAATLVDDLWSGDEGTGAPADPLNALQSLVSRLRRLLPVPSVLESSASGYRLAVSADEVDATRFETLVGQGRTALRKGDALTAASLLEQAGALWRGVPLADLDGAAFTQPYVSHLEQLHLAARDDCREAVLQLGRGSELVPELEALVGADPLRERSAAQLVRALAAAGRQADALAAYDRTRTSLVEELGLDPSAELAAARQSVLTGAPPPAAPEHSRSNLPTAITSFVGREEELDRLQHLMSTSRLVTLTGPGGAGKTRLAIAAARAASDVPAGVWLVELAPVNDPDDLPAAVFGALSARETNLLDRVPSSDGDALGRLVDLLSGRRLLLVLDNCEHLVEAAARVADQLLTHCPQLRILATSREPLSIFGEAICPVLPLAMPAVGIAAGRALDFASVRLFADRADAVRPGFAVDAETVEPVVEICRRLDGLPLAIELAAARLRTLPVEVVAARLADRFRLLTGGSRTAVARHQTLRSVVAWSWELLTEDERRLAESLAVFHGGMTVESAMAVSGATYDDTLELLVALADKSILQPVGGNALRWRMLETLREYGTEQLTAQGRTDEVRAAHAGYFCTLAENAEPRLRAPEQMTYVHRLSAERENLNAALRFTIDTPDVVTAVRLGAALAWYWHLVGGDAEARAWLGQIIDLPGATQHPGSALALVGWSFSLIGSAADPAEHHERAERLLAAFRATPVEGQHPLVAMLEPGLALILGDDRTAMAAIERQMNHPDPWARAALQLVRGLIAENSGDMAGVRESSALALDGFRQAGDRWGIAMALSTSAGVAVLDGDLDSAVEQYAEAVQLLEELGSVDDVSYLLLRSAMALDRHGRHEQARVELYRAREMALDRGAFSILLMTDFAIAQQLAQDGDVIGGRDFTLEAIERAKTVQNVAPQALASMYCALADLEQILESVEEAFEHVATAWELALGSHDMPVVALAGVKLAELVLASGQPAVALRLLGATDSIRGAPDLSDPRAAKLISAAQEAGGLDAEAAEIEVATGRSLPPADAITLVQSRFSRPVSPSVPRPQSR
ncbi:MAG TPA: BTAD domain-containing putative transcriptional regulator [Frankiaceae bacterium]|nr:BTAD domain-containing putative transcriptional regulator [Frankiaceae bacterium]